MHITRPQLAGIICKMLGNGRISLDEYDIIDWDDGQLDELTCEYLKACGKEVSKEMLFDCMSEMDVTPICFNALKNSLYSRIEDEIRESIIDILTEINIEDKKHRRAEHEYSQS